MTADGLMIAGSSPATISVFRRGSAQPLTTLNPTMHVRNAIHGLEIWPFDQCLTDGRQRQGQLDAGHGPGEGLGPARTGMTPA